jgi:tRNA nucleotidyltransferase (CCA-adding enzyme)
VTARRAQAYPQVDARASGLIDMRVTRCPADASVARALALLRARSGRALVPAGGQALVLPEDLARAVALGLETLRAVELARPVPVARATEPEIAVRRRLRAGARAVLVMNRVQPLGAVSPAALGARAPAGPALVRRLRARLSAEALELLTEVGRLAAAAGGRAFAVGGLVRDALLDDGPRRPRPEGRDLDVVVEGDAIAIARRVAGGLGGTLTIHEAFGTASIEGLRPGRLDLVTARAERYRAPGALPTVRAGTIQDDLARRDFGVNAMAAELGSGAFGLLDPLGGRQDVLRRRLRVLHPLSFVEDPTRIFRASRYAVRLGLTLERATLRAQGLALRLAPYAALSGERIAAEIERVLADVAPARTLKRLGAAGAFRLLDPRFRFSGATAARIKALPGALAWVRAHGLAVAPLELAALALAGEQSPEVAAAALRGLGFSGQPLARLCGACAAASRLAEGLAGLAGTPASRRAALLRGRPAIELAGAWLGAPGPVRAALDWYLGDAVRVRGVLRGEQLIALGVPNGPAVGLVLGKLRDARIDGTARSREDEEALVRRWAEGRLGSTERGEG